MVTALLKEGLECIRCTPYLGDEGLKRLWIENNPVPPMLIIASPVLCSAVFGGASLSATVDFVDTCAPAFAIYCQQILADVSPLKCNDSCVVDVHVCPCRHTRAGLEGSQVMKLMGATLSVA